MLKKITSLLLSLCLSAAAVSGLTVTASAAETTGQMTEFGFLENGVYHIQTAEHLKNISTESQNANHPVNNYNQTFVLDNDIELTENDANSVNIASNQSGAVFHGTFDGNGHTISGLKYDRHLIATGLFGHTEGATIKNLVIERADINATYIGGIVAGYADNTDFINVSVRNSTMTCIPGNVSIAVFTDAGMSVGALAGQAVNRSLIYNCESVNTSLNASEVSGGTALGGSGAYFGGLVGSLVDSHVEYSRTISEGNVNNGNITYTTTAILGVANGAYIYTGGICGELKAGASVIDSFSNISMHNQYDTSAALGVLSCSYGFVGGIAGAMYGPETSVERCQYSGYSEAWDYIILVGIGGIYIGRRVDNNEHLGGIIGKIDNDYHTNINDRVKNCYYNSDRMMEHKDKDEEAKSAVAWRNPLPSIYRSLAPNKCDSYSEEEYKDQTSSWADNGFDFDGTEKRKTPCSVLFGGEGANHVNKWVMHTYNYDRNITDELTTSFIQTTMPIHASANVNIYSNINNAFVENPTSMEYQYSINADNTVTLPNKSTVSDIDPGLQNEGFIGFAFVSEREFEGQNVYTCDALYLPGTEVDANVFETYGIDPDKRIYAVWCQAKTLGAQLGLNAGNEGLRVLTAVNTDLLDNIGLDLPDDEYGRGATFVMDNKKYLIKADSREWRGEAYYDESTINDIKYPRVFSIFAAMDKTDYGNQITYSGDILWFGKNADGTKAVFDFICNSDTYRTSVSDIAERYLSDLEASGASEAENYGLTDEQYGVLKQYID